MSTYKLTYWNARGLAEVARLLFAVSDNRIVFEEDRKTWLTVKHTFKWERIPELLVDGVALNQSKAIERFLAKRFGMFGANDVETGILDGFSETVRDIGISYMAVKSDANKLAKFWTDDLPSILHILSKNAGNNGHFVGDKFTLPDIQFYFFMTTHFDAQDKVNACLAKHENLKKIVEKVTNNDRIKEYVSKRAPAPF